MYFNIIAFFPVLEYQNSLVLMQLLLRSAFSNYMTPEIKGDMVLEA